MELFSIRIQRTFQLVSTFDIRMIDHIIIAGDTYYSFADEGRL